MKHNTLEVIMGAVVLVLAGAILWKAYTASQQTVNSSYQISAQFSSVAGLVKGNDVRISGVKVGHVADIDLNNETFMATVILNLDESLKLPADTSAEITSESLMGGKYITLSPGADTEFMKNGDMVEFTQSSVSIESLISKFVVQE